MQTKRPLAPGFLNQLDQRLLLHKPEAWSSRTHLVVYYGLLIILGIAAISFIVPDDPRSASPAGYWIGFVSILSILGLVTWLIYLLRFNVFKRYGTISKWSGLTVFLHYFIAVGIFVLFPFTEPLVESIRANNAYTSEELATDINHYNTLVAQLEYDSLDHHWNADTFRIRKNAKGMQAPQQVIVSRQEEIAMDTIVLTPIPPMTIIDSASFADKLAFSDSTIKLDDSTYILYETPDYSFLSNYHLDGHSTVAVLRDIDIYRNTIQNFIRPDRSAALKALRSIITKYEIPPGETGSYYYGYSEYAPESLMARLRKRYKTDELSTSISNITERKYRWDEENLYVYLRIFYYITLGISLLVFLFRHSTRQSFFLSLLSVLILTILTALFAAFTRQEEIGIMSIMLLYFISFFIVSFTSWNSKRRSVVTGISLNLWVYMLPFVPLIGYALYTRILIENAQNTGNWDTYDSIGFADYVAYAEIVGAVLLLAMLLLYIRRAYRQWYALPEQ